MFRTRVLAGSVLVVFWAAVSLWADVIITKTGDKYEGYIVRETETEIVINHQGIAEVPIRKADIIQHKKAGDKTEEAKEGEDAAKSDSTSKPAVSKGKTVSKKPAAKKASKHTAAKPASRKKTTSKKTTPKKTTDDASGGSSEEKGSSKDKSSKSDGKSGEE